MRVIELLRCAAGHSASRRLNTGWGQCPGYLQNRFDTESVLLATKSVILLPTVDIRRQEVGVCQLKSVTPVTAVNNMKLLGTVIRVSDRPHTFV